MQLSHRNRSAIAAGALVLASAALTSAFAQERPSARCEGLLFSTEEDFVTRGPEPPDGNPIISDGDLLVWKMPGGDARLCARNSELLGPFKTNPQIARDLGLDAVYSTGGERPLILFSTELDDPEGRFTAGDLLTTSAGIIPNAALLAQTDVPPSRGDLGLDAVEIRGEPERVRRFFRNLNPDALRENPGLLAEMQKRFEIEILVSVEGTFLSPERRSFLDGDLLSTLSGDVVASNADLLPGLPAGLPMRGVDFGLDAFTQGHDPIENVGLDLLSTEISSLRKGTSFTDGDVLQAGPAVFLKNGVLIHSLEPVVAEVGLDALHMTPAEDPCGVTEITEIGGIVLSLIDQNPASSTVGYARKDDGAHPPPPPPAAAPYDRPFGQTVSIRGNLPRPDCIDVNRYEYRVEFRDIDGGGGWSPIVWSAAKGWQFLQRSFFFGCLGSTWNPYASDSDGWFSLATYWRAKSCHPDHAFAVWRTGGRDGHYALRLTMREIGDPATEVSSSVVQVQLDNTKPVRPPAADEHQAVQMDFYDLGGTILADQCTVDEATAAAVLIKGRVRDKHFRRYTMRWTGGDFHGWDHVDLGPGEGSDYRYYDAARPDLGGEGTIPGTATDVPLGRFDVVAEHTAETGNPPPECGFTVELRAYDRTIRGGFKPAENNYRDGYQNGWWESYNNSFCYKPKSAE